MLSGKPDGSPTSIEERDYVRTLMRMRSVMLATISLTLAFWPFDLLIVWAVYPHGHPLRYLALRAVAVPGAAFILWRLRRRPRPGPWILAAGDYLVYCTGAAAMGCIGAELGGIEGPYPPVALLALIVRGSAYPQPWRQGLLPNLAVIVSFFAGLMVWGHESVVAEQLGSLRGQALFAIHFSGDLLGATILTLSSHNAWLLEKGPVASRRLGAYRLVEKLGTGGFGEVWRAVDVRTGTNVALKTLQGERAFDQTARRRFEKEFKAYTQLQHPGIVRTRDFGVTEDGLYYLAMDLIEGTTVGEYVQHKGPLDPDETWSLAMEVAHALAHAHSRGVVHRDVTPYNVMVVRSTDSGPRVRLFDFGIAAIRSQQTRLTRTGGIVGTPDFMAPEALAGAPPHPTLDVFAFGALVVFLRTGFPPRHGFGKWHALQSATHGTDSDGRMAGIVRRCLCPTPAERFRDAEELLDSLRRSEPA